MTENKGERYLNLFCQNYYQVVSSWVACRHICDSCMEVFLLFGQFSFDLVFSLEMGFGLILSNSNCNDQLWNRAAKLDYFHHWLSCRLVSILLRCGTWQHKNFIILKFQSFKLSCSFDKQSVIQKIICFQHPIIFSVLRRKQLCQKDWLVFVWPPYWLMNAFLLGCCHCLFQIWRTRINQTYVFNSILQYTSVLP